MIEVEALSKSFAGQTVLKAISFSVDKGQVLGFLGPNGAGKSTTMRILSGFLARDAGRVSLCGFDPQERALEVQTRLGYLPEGVPLWPEMTPGDFLSTIADMRGLDRKKEKIAEIAEKTAIAHMLERPVENLSKGYKRRVGLAQALIHDPDILILDEPTDGLDPNQKHHIRNLIRDIAADKAVIISTHILDEVEAICSHALVLDEGEIKISGTPKDIAGKAPAGSKHPLEDAFRQLTNKSLPLHTASTKKASPDEKSSKKSNKKSGAKT